MEQPSEWENMSCQIMRAIVRDDSDVLELLLRAKTSLKDVELPCKLLPIELALSCSASSLKILIDCGAEITKKSSSDIPFIDDVMLGPCCGGKSDKLKRLLDAGLSPDAKMADGKRSLLMRAAGSNAAIVSLLCKNKASVNLRDPDGNTALFYAISYDAATYADDELLVILAELASSGADFNVRNGGGFSAEEVLSRQKILPVSLKEQALTFLRQRAIP